MQTKGVLLPLGQQPGGTGVGSSRVKQCSRLFAHNPPPTHASTIPQLLTTALSLFFPSSPLGCPSETKGMVSFQAETASVTQTRSLGTAAAEEPYGQVTSLDLI